MVKIKLSEWAKKNAVCYRTAWNYFKKGKFDKNSEISDSGSIFILDNEVCNSGDVFIYGRVSSLNKKEDLNSQVSLCEQFCLARGWSISKTYKEIASGMNDNRKMLNKIIDNPPSILVILHKDRLTRFGFNFVKKALKAKGCEIVCINENTNDQEDLIKDFIAIITSFCCRIYGARRGQAKALKMKESIND
jgi:predicted site-specific integrase-resolvase